MKSVWETSTAHETYQVNTSSYSPALDGIRVQSFCHSFLYPGYKNTNQSYPYIMASLILSGCEEVVTPDGDTIRRKPGFFKLSDLNVTSERIYRGQETLERYFLLFEVSPLLREILARLFPEKLPMFVSPAPERLRKCFEDVRDALSKDAKPDDTLVSGMAFRLFMEAARQFPRSPVPAPLTMSLRYIDNHFCEPGLNRERVAMASGVSVSTLGKLFRVHLKTTIQEQIATLRMAKVKHMLSFSVEPVSVIAESCGFSYSYYLAREFRKRFGIPPLQYREQTRCRVPLP